MSATEPTLSRAGAGSRAGTMLYDTFVRRVGAVGVDLAVLLPLLVVAEHGSRAGGNTALQTAGVLVPLFLSPLYRTLLHAWCGQTLGKRLLGLRVVRAGDGLAVPWHRCLVRDGPEYLVGAATAFHLHGLLQQGNYTPGQVDGTPVGQGLAACYVGWIFLDALVVFANARKRALHDFLAGTVVIRTPARRRKKAVSASRLPL